MGTGLCCHGNYTISVSGEAGGGSWGSQDVLGGRGGAGMNWGSLGWAPLLLLATPPTHILGTPTGVFGPLYSPPPPPKRMDGNPAHRRLRPPRGVATREGAWLQTPTKPPVGACPRLAPPTVPKKGRGKRGRGFSRHRLFFNRGRGFTWPHPLSKMASSNGGGGAKEQTAHTKGYVYCGWGDMYKGGGGRVIPSGAARPPPPPFGGGV